MLQGPELAAGLTQSVVALLGPADLLNLRVFQDVPSYHINVLFQEGSHVGSELVPSSFLREEAR